MRFRLREGERSSKYRPGQFVSKEYAERYRDKVERSLTRAERSAIKREQVRRMREEEAAEEMSDFWEITVKYPE